jgi:hypothetical protein
MSSKKKIEIREEDLYKPISEYLTNLGYTVKGEVKHCDIVAVKDEELLVVEMKKSLNLDLILQAALRQKLADVVYIAVPKPGRALFSKRWQDLYYLLKRLQFGLIFVSFKEGLSLVEVVFDPVPFDMSNTKKKNNKKKQELLKEFEARHGDFNTGGSTRKKLVTAYREQAIHIACCLMKYGPMSPKALRELGTDEKKTQIILKNNHYKWFEHIDDKLYGMSEKGIREVSAYAELCDYYMKSIEDRKTE